MSGLARSGSLAGRSASGQTPPPLPQDAVRQKALDDIFWVNVAANKVLAAEFQKMIENLGQEKAVEAMKAAMSQNNDSLRAIVREESEKAVAEARKNAEADIKKAKKAQLEAQHITSLAGARDQDAFMKEFWTFFTTIFGGAGVVLFIVGLWKAPILGTLALGAFTTLSWLCSRARNRAQTAQMALNDEVLKRLREAGGDGHHH